MRIYDVILVLKTNLTDAKRKQAVDGIKALLKGSKVVKEDEIGQKVLAYPIKKEQAGFFVSITVEMDVLPSDFESKLFQEASLLRHLVIRGKDTPKTAKTK